MFAGSPYPVCKKLQQGREQPEWHSHYTVKVLQPLLRIPLLVIILYTKTLSHCIILCYLIMISYKFKFLCIFSFRAVGHMFSTLFWPIIPFILEIFIVLLWLSIALFVSTSYRNHYTVVDAPSDFSIANGTDCDFDVSSICKAHSPRLLAVMIFSLKSLKLNYNSKLVVYQNL